MTKISINLLPVELRAETLTQKRGALVMKLSTFSLLAMLLVTSALLTFRFIQSTQNQRLAAQIRGAKEKISSLAEREQLSVILRQRLVGINGLLSQDSPSSTSFNLISTLTPPQVKIINFNADKGGKVLLDGETNELTALNKLFDNLTDPKKHEGRIAITRVESLSRSQDRIKFALVITLK